MFGNGNSVPALTNPSSQSANFSHSNFSGKLFKLKEVGSLGRILSDCVYTTKVVLSQLA